MDNRSSAESNTDSGFIKMLEGIPPTGSARASHSSSQKAMDWRSVDRALRTIAIAGPSERLTVEPCAVPTANQRAVASGAARSAHVGADDVMIVSNNCGLARRPRVTDRAAASDRVAYDAHVGADGVASDRVPRGAHVGADDAMSARNNGDLDSGPVPSKLDLAVVRTQAKQALVGLGWKPAIAAEAVRAAATVMDANAPLERWIFEALRRCPRPVVSR